MLFGNRKKEQNIDTSSNAELYQGIRVMQDDLDELSGKRPATSPVSPVNTSQHTGTSSGSPFLSDQYPAQADNQSETRGATEKYESAGAGNDTQTGGVQTPEAFSGFKRLFSGIEPAGDTASEASAPDVSREASISGSASVANGKSWILLVSALALIALVAGAAVYIFMFSGTDGGNQTSATVPQQSDTNQPAPPVQSTGPDAAPFTQGMPNFLSMDIESEASTPDGIRKLLSDAEASVMRAKPSFPVEFVIRDANNNPVAFARFAYLLGLKIPMETLASLDEGFSLYFVFDGTAVRRVAVMDIRQGKDVTKDLSDGETSIVSWFGTLLYPNTVSIPAGTSFQTGSYGKLATRFINIDVANDTSFDYAILDRYLVIGSSKESFRSVLGTIVGSK